MDHTLKRLAPLSGVAFALAYVAGIYLTMNGSPEFAGRSDDIVGFYQANSDHILVGTLVLFAATPLWFLFLGSLWSGIRLKEGGAGRLAITVIAAGTAGAAVDMCGEALHAMAAVRAQEGSLTSTLATMYFDAATVLSYTGTAAEMAAFALGIGIVSFRYGALVPRWLGLLAIVVAVVSVIPPISWAVLFPGLAFISWISVSLFRQRAGFI